MKQVKIKLDGGIMPRKATEGAAAYDLYVPEDIEIKGWRQVVDLKFSIELPEGYAATIQPRSGFSAKGIEVGAQYIKDDGSIRCEIVRVDGDVVRGLIDADYRGKVGVILHYACLYSSVDRVKHIIKKGTRIAQMQIVEVPKVELVEVSELSDTDRGEGGFGSTGTK